MPVQMPAESGIMLSGVLALIIREIFKAKQEKKVIKQQTGYFTDIKESIDELHAITTGLTEKAVDNALKITAILTRFEMYDRVCGEHKRHQEELNKNYETHINCLHDKLYNIVSKGILNKEEKDK